VPPAGCAAWTCDACPPDRVGRTFCEGNDLYGCLASGHPRCGILCKKKLVSQCETCVDSGGVVTCDGNLIVPICLAHSCDKCPAGEASFCDGSTVRACLRASFGGGCAELCDLDEVEVCAGGCAEDGQGGAACTAP
jgi:hypothetical protein